MKNDSLSPDTETSGLATGSYSKIDLHDPSVRRQVEQSLTTIPGVRAARLVPGFDREVDELHVVAAVDRAPKQIVRDVQSALVARYGVTTDHRVVSVVQFDDDTIESDTAREVRIRRVHVGRDGLRSTVEVVIGAGEQELVGQDDGPSSGPGRRRAIARATLQALRPLLPEDRAIEVEGVDVALVLGHQVAVCLLHVHSSSGSGTRCGSAMVIDDEAQAVARAVLDATNRLVGAR